SFAPQKSTQIPSFNVTVDGKVYKTQPLKIEVVKPTASKAGAPYMLQMQLDKHRVKVGESLRLDLKFKQKRGTKADKIEITPPKLENFWVKEIKGSRESLEGDYVVHTYSYLLFPQKAGDYTIPSVTANIGTRVKRRNRLGGAFDDPFFDDPFFNSFVSSIKWQKLFSNEEKLHVDPLPDHLEVFGHFTIKADVDKHAVSAGKPVNLTITIEGEGNVDDIKKFDLDIPDAVVYADEPKIETGLRNGKYVGTFRQKIAIVADHDYTIPPVTFTYFDKVAQKKVTIKTDPISVKVKGGAKGAVSAPKMVASKALTKEIEEASKGPEVSKNVAQSAPAGGISPWLYLLAGLLLGAVATYAALMIRQKGAQKAPAPVTKLIRKAKSDKELYNLLLPYAKEGPFMEEVLHKLEENLYKGAHHKIDRNEIVDFFEEVVEGD
ncbi:MAG TPA: hypothetical protein ENK93_03165, partial [Campylobacteraceae bacterium]|nr:hypothetical protein [Campylobacteraceae bacterium]